MALQGYLVNAWVIKGSILGFTLSYYTLITFQMISSLNLLCIDDSTFYCKCDQACDLLQQLELASGLESDLWDTVDRK